MRKIITRVALACAMLAGLFTGAVATAPMAGAAPVACPGSPYGNGWFDSMPGSSRPSAINCTIEGNHIVLDQWQGSCVFRGVIDIWHGAQADALEFIDSNSSFIPFEIRFRNNSGQLPAPGLHGPAYTTNDGIVFSQYYNPTSNVTVNMTNAYKYYGQLPYANGLDGWMTYDYRGWNNWSCGYASWVEMKSVISDGGFNQYASLWLS